MEQEIRKEAAHYSMKLYEMHTSQRMSHFRFYIIMLSVFFAGLGVLAKEQNYILLLSLSTFFLIATFVFQSLDKRTVQLVRNSQEYLIEYENFLSGAINNPAVKFFEKGSTTQFPTNTKCFTLLYSASYILGFLWSCYALNGLCGRI